MSTLTRPKRAKAEPAAGDLGVVARPRWRGWRPSVPVGFLSLLGGAVLWEAVARIWNVSFFPPLSAVLARLWEMIADGEILRSLGNSLINLVIGFAIAVTVGVGVGLAMGAYKKIDQALDMYVYALLTAPSLVFAPIFFSVFGLGRASIVGVIVMYATFIIIINTATAIRSVPVALIEMGRSFCASDWQIFRRIVIPAAMPLIMAGLRLGMGRAVKGMINGEMFIAAVGLGAVVMDAGRRFDAETILAVLLVIIAVAVATMKLVQLLDRRVTAWLPS
ncbi:MAG TPA: ABC transporter permease, partial [Actinomycetota bacterium]|nr:ABC transporter permease [Actinomycetota bacterium]